MDLNDDEIKSALSSPPFARNGFNMQLKEAIERRLDEPVRRQRWKLPAAAMACAMLLTVVLWYSISNSPPLQLQQNQLDQMAQNTASEDMNNAKPAEVTDVEPHVLSSALMIGFRTDHELAPQDRTSPPWSYSDYRTMLIAPIEGSLRMIAEGEGLLIPFGQQFWRIDTSVQITETDKHQLLTAYPATESRPTAAEIFDNPTEAVSSVQRILFAGNRYVAIEETKLAYSPAQNLHLSDTWIGELGPSPFKNTVSLTSLFGLTAEDTAELNRIVSPTVDNNTLAQAQLIDDRWTIIRRHGEWVPAASTLNKSSGRREYVPLPLELPEAVVSYDELCCDWEDIVKAEPEAVDVLSSPTEDIVVILTPERLSVYPLRDGQLGSAQLLSLDLQLGEKLVMAQWAVDTYVPLWIEAAEPMLQLPAN